MVKTGDPAPNAKLKLSDHEKVNIDFELQSAYDAGLTVLYFFPAAFTGVCSQSSCQLRDEIDKYEELGASIYGISVDTPFVLKKFHLENNLNYPLLSDWNKDAITLFKIVDNDFAGGLKGFAKRSLYAIKDSEIIYKWVAEIPGNYPPFEELLNRLSRT